MMKFLLVVLAVATLFVQTFADGHEGGVAESGQMLSSGSFSTYALSLMMAGFLAVRLALR